MDKCIRNGKVGVIVSDDKNIGFSTEMSLMVGNTAMFNSHIIEYIMGGEQQRAQDFAKFYYNLDKMGELSVTWIDEDEDFVMLPTTRGHEEAVMVKDLSKFFNVIKA